MGKYVIKNRSNGEFQFNLKAGNGEIILTSEGYATKGSCVRGINSTIVDPQIYNRYEQMVATGGIHYFVLKASNGEDIGTSEMYNSKAGMLSGIDPVLVNGRSD